MACYCIDVDWVYSYKASAWRTGCESPRFSNDMEILAHKCAAGRIALMAHGNAAVSGPHESSTFMGTLMPARVKRESLKSTKQSRSVLGPLEKRTFTGFLVDVHAAMMLR